MTIYDIGRARDLDGARMQHFQVLDPLQKTNAIVRLSITGMNENDIAFATGLSVGMIRQLLRDTGYDQCAPQAPRGVS